MGLNLEGGAPSGVGAPDQKIEITPEMIECGVSALRGEMVGGAVGLARQFLEDAVIRIYREMARKVPTGSNPNP